MVSLGVWSCRWRELRPITFGGNNGRKKGAGGGDVEADERGGRGDGAGVYEMVSTKEAG